MIADQPRSSVTTALSSQFTNLADRIGRTRDLIRNSFPKHANFASFGFIRAARHGDNPVNIDCAGQNSDNAELPNEHRKVRSSRHFGEPFNLANLRSRIASFEWNWSIIVRSHYYRLGRRSVSVFCEMPASPGFRFMIVVRLQCRSFKCPEDVRPRRPTLIRDKVTLSSSRWLSWQF